MVTLDALAILLLLLLLLLTYKDRDPGGLSRLPSVSIHSPVTLLSHKYSSMYEIGIHPRSHHKHLHSSTSDISLVRRAPLEKLYISLTDKTRCQHLIFLFFFFFFLVAGSQSSRVARLSLSVYIEERSTSPD